MTTVGTIGFWIVAVAGIGVLGAGALYAIIWAWIQLVDVVVKLLGVHSCVMQVIWWRYGAKNTRGAAKAIAAELERLRKFEEQARRNDRDSV